MKKTWITVLYWYFFKKLKERMIEPGEKETKDAHKQLENKSIDGHLWNQKLLMFTITSRVQSKIAMSYYLMQSSA